MSTLFDFLPKIQFADPDVTKVQADLYATYEQTTGRTLFPGQPERLFLDSVAAEMSRLLYIVDFTGQQNLLVKAYGSYLDGLGSLFNVQRLPASAARVFIRFELNEAVDWPVSIDAETRVTPDGTIVFTTASTLTIQPGDTSGTVEAVCQAPGAQGNGYVAGQVNQLIDPIAYVARAVNESTSLGGANAEADDRLRERIALAPTAFSCCGSADAYKFHARSVSPAITDVAIHVPSPGRVHVSVLTQDGAAPTEIIAAVAGALNGEKVRPISDTVVVQAPEQVEYDIDLTYSIQASHGHLESRIREQVRAEIDGYEVWQSAKLGRAINPSELIARVRQVSGVHSVDVALPLYQALEPYQLATLGTKNAGYEGLANG